MERCNRKRPVRSSTVYNGYRLTATATFVPLGQGKNQGSARLFVSFPPNKRGLASQVSNYYPTNIWVAEIGLGRK